ncbi:MAG: Holliday junction resolvase RuvX [Christensenellaceae bacterium]|nr:Holliday junction resolvase RuvX [Christensenellaceae bacterium]
MGLDVGDKRIGIAFSDPLRLTAQGHESYTRKSEQMDIDHMVALCAEYKVEYIVCGLPKNMNGTIGPMAEKVMAFGEKVAEASGKRIVYVDERLTTVQAERTLLEADISRAKRRKVVDKLAAVNILQTHLDTIR